MTLFRTVLLLSIVLVAKANNDDRVAAENCMKEVGIDPDLYRSAMRDPSKGVDQKIKCVDACMLKYYKVMDEDGTISIDKVMEFITDATDEIKEAKRKAFEKCTLTKEENICDLAHNMIQCMNEEMRKINK